MSCKQLSHTLTSCHKSHQQTEDVLLSRLTAGCFVPSAGLAVAVHPVRGQPDGDMGGQPGLHAVCTAPRLPSATQALPEPPDQGSRDVGCVSPVPDGMTAQSLHMLPRSMRCVDHCAFAAQSAEFAAPQVLSWCRGRSAVQEWCKPHGHRWECKQQDDMCCCTGEAGQNTMWRVENGEAVAANACPKLFQVYTVRKSL